MPAEYRRRRVVRTYGIEVDHAYLPEVPRGYALDGTPPPSFTFKIALETGMGFIILESGDNILLETAP